MPSVHTCTLLSIHVYSAKHNLLSLTLIVNDTYFFKAKLKKKHTVEPYIHSWYNVHILFSYQDERLLSILVKLAECNTKMKHDEPLAAVFVLMETDRLEQ